MVSGTRKREESLLERLAIHAFLRLRAGGIVVIKS
jgi:hypothetical protein